MFEIIRSKQQKKKKNYLLVFKLLSIFSKNLFLTFVKRLNNIDVFADLEPPIKIIFLSDYSRIIQITKIYNLVQKFEGFACLKVELIV